METKIRSVKFNFIMNFILTASSFIFPLITYPYISRVLLVDGNGQISFATSVLSYFSMFASLGIPTYGIRACAQIRDDKIELTKTVQELLIINLISTAITYLAFFLSLVTVPIFREDKNLLLINSLSLILNTIGVNWFYSALEQYSYITIRSLVFKVLSIIFMFLLVHRQDDYLIYAAITVLATGGSNILNFIHLRHYISLKPVGHYDLSKHLKPIFLFFGSAVASSIYTNLDLVMLRFLSTVTEVGYYQVAVKVKMLLTTLVTSLGAVLLPRLSYYVKQGKDEEFRNITVKALNFILIFASAITAYFIIFAKETVLILSGAAFLNAVLPLQIIMPSILFIGLSYVTGLQILIPLMKEKQMMISYIIASVFDFVLNLIIIPHWKASGAAFSTAFAELCVLIIQCYYLLPILKIILKKVSFLKAGLSLLISTIVILLVKIFIYEHFSMHSLVILIFTSIIFFAVDFIVLFILREPFVIKTVIPSIKKILPFYDKP